MEQSDKYNKIDFSERFGGDEIHIYQCDRGCSDGNDYYIKECSCYHILAESSTKELKEAYKDEYIKKDGLKDLIRELLFNRLINDKLD